MARTGTEIERACVDGEHIVTEGEVGREMFVIRSGHVRITKKVGDKEVTLAELEKGDFFGEMSLLESTARDANAISIGPTRLLVIQPGGLLVRIRRDPTFAMEMLHRLSNRLRIQNARMVEALDALDDVDQGAAERVLMYQGAHEK